MSADRAEGWRSPALSWLARPLSLAYGAGASWRRRRAARPGYRHFLRRPVISVGNLTVGGAGKTPVVESIARWLVERGEYPAVLSRGYARQRPSDHAVVVRDAAGIRGGLAESGDEPLMLAQSLPGAAVVVAADRFVAGTAAEQLGCTIHVLDDGFQHVQLYRDLDLLLVSEADLISERVLPAGRLREPASAASCADAWLTDGAALNVVTPLARRAGVPRVFSVRTELGVAEVVGTGPIPNPPPARVLLVTGIARPGRVAADTRAAGWTVADHMVFPDHHPFTPRDVQTIGTRVVEVHATAVLTTEKDAVRLEPLAPFPCPVLKVPVRAVVEPDMAFTAWLAERIAHARATRADG